MARIKTYILWTVERKEFIQISNLKTLLNKTTTSPNQYWTELLYKKFVQVSLGFHCLSYIGVC